MVSFRWGGLRTYTIYMIPQKRENVKWAGKVSEKREEWGEIFKFGFIEEINADVGRGLAPAAIQKMFVIIDFLRFRREQAPALRHVGLFP